MVFLFIWDLLIQNPLRFIKSIKQIVQIGRKQRKTTHFHRLLRHIRRIGRRHTNSNLSFSAKNKAQTNRSVPYFFVVEGIWTLPRRFTGKGKMPEALAVREKARAFWEEKRSIGHGSAIDDYFDEWNAKHFQISPSRAFYIVYYSSKKSSKNHHYFLKNRNTYKKEEPKVQNLKQPLLALNK